MWLCLFCFQTTEPEEAEGAKACPKCGRQGIPADLEDVFTGAITKHELRVLVVWAERWAVHLREHLPDMRATVAGIAKRLGVATLSDELAELADAFPGMWTNFPIHRDDSDPRGQG